MECQSGFDYGRAFSRNIGWLTGAEQQRIRQARVAIAGMGGVGGAHLLTLSRLGVGRFSLADFDDFDLHNMNRQAGAFMSTLGQPKIDVMSRMARDINPELNLRCFPEGVTEANVDEFLRDASIYVDSLDLFALPARRLVFARCRELGIPALTAATLGMGVAFLHFSPKGMSFEEYFRLDGCSAHAQYARVTARLSRALLSRRYLVVPRRLNCSESRGLSTPRACDP